MMKEMSWLKVGVLVGGAVSAMGVGIVLAGTPFGGDDSGFIPPAANFKCVSGFAKNASKYAAGIAGCHIKAASAAFAAKPFDEEACETALRAKIDATNAKLTGCPSCLNQAAVLDFAVDQLDSANAVFFCGGTTPLGGDDGGVVPTDKNVLKCESAVVKGVGKLSAAIVKCHIKQADAVIKGKAFDEEACEDKEINKFNAANTKIAAICPPCLSGLFGVLGDQVEQQIDNANGDTWCASPSGAFID